MAKDGDAPHEPVRAGGAPQSRAQTSATSHLSGANAAYLTALYAKFAQAPASVSADWRAFFEEFGDPADAAAENARGPSWRRRDWPPAANGELTAAFDADWAETEKSLKSKIEKRAPVADADAVKQATQDSLRALMLIRAYRIRGHLIADLDPLGLQKKTYNPELDPASLGFTEADMDRPIFIDNVLGLETASLRQIIDILKRTYCGTFAVEFMHISDPDRKSWLQQRIEGPEKEISFTPEGKQAILKKLIEAEGFENFLNIKYTGTKRFGLDGAEAMVPALEQIIKRGGALGVEEIVIGMPHRGRLNVLAAVMGKPYHHIFHEFQGGSVTPEDVDGSGDVKYHLGASSDREFDGNKVHLSLTANPSHLEAVDPVVLGKARSKQDRIKPPETLEAPRTHVLPLLLHGDAA
ncbi:MAG: 2-oxoglutarate dehydrogenase E1 component, partial [Parvularculaceae bacterium]